ncbi:TetR family transcriptional regulator [Conexibacter sp. W3-3-2]|uniref:TetR/AcrR family transcriptional regulator n=1 Tax=Conexibacter sp. W3-3-2 TaxID=2675227 RepID=UPI0012BA091E|nr:TetR/AcrR family transcriptional regulator [Conexibacter sp. W3-3-2]MTD43569.1 TetR family transcriptional regulator [Conexibacter sp. W3-3-2]
MATPQATDDRPLRADARRNRERIIAAAREVFSEYGGLAQIDEVARRAGCGVGTVYRNFPTKDALVGELVRLKFERLVERATHYNELPGSAYDNFEAFVRESAEHMASDVAQQRMMWESSEEAFAHALDAQLRLQRIGGALIERAQAEGRLHPDFSVTDMPVMMCSLGSAMLMASGPGGERHDWRRLLEIVIAGISLPG